MPELFSSSTESKLSPRASATHPETSEDKFNPQSQRKDPFWEIPDLIRFFEAFHGFLKMGRKKKKKKSWTANALCEDAWHFVLNFISSAPSLPPPRLQLIHGANLKGGQEVSHPGFSRVGVAPTVKAKVNHLCRD